MTLIHYVGSSDSRTIFASNFVANGVNDQGTTVWNESNLWQVNVSTGAGNYLLTLSDFSLTGISRPGTGGGPPGPPPADPGLHPSLASHDALGLATQAELDAAIAGVGSVSHPNLAAHDTLGLATQAEVDALSGIYATRAGNLTDLNSLSAARTNLGLDSAKAAVTQPVFGQPLNVALTGLPIVDGYQTVAGDVVLLTAQTGALAGGGGQTAAAENGPWVVAAGAWARPSWFAAGSVQAGRGIFVLGGSRNTGTTWMLATTGTVTVGTTLQTWVRNVKLPPGTDQVRYASKVGSDANDGLSWRSAKLTVQAAIDSIEAWNGVSVVPRTTGTVHIGIGTFQETVTPRSGMKLTGQGATNVGTIIKAPSDTADCINLTTQSQCTIENLFTVGFSGTWSGVGLRLYNSASTRVNNWGHSNGTGWGLTSTGIGLRIERSEGCLFQGATFAECNIGVLMSDYAIENVLTDFRLGVCHQDLVMTGFQGANVFIHWKGTYSSNGTGFVVDMGGIAGSGGNVFIMFDSEESFFVGGTNWRVSSDDNIFLGGVTGPQTDMTVTGSRNVFENFSILLLAVDTGTANVWRKPRMTNSVLDLSGATNAEITGEFVVGTGAAVIYGSAVRPVVRPASQPTTAQEAVNVVAASGAAQTLPSPVTAQSISRITLTANCTFTFPTLVAGRSFTLTLVQPAPANVSNKALTANVATLTTVAAHGFIAGNVVTVAGVDATFDGVHTLTASSPTTFSYAQTAADVVSVAATGTAYTPRSVVWPATVKWPAGTAPTLSAGANKIDYLSFVSTNGTTWAGFVAGLDIR